VGILYQEKVKTLDPTQAYRACLPMKAFLYPLITPLVKKLSSIIVELA
jgi:hypothetical protein